MKNSLSLAEVASLLRIPFAVAKKNDLAGTLPFVRVNGDEYISTSAALTMYLEGKFDVAAQTRADEQAAPVAYVKGFAVTAEAAAQIAQVEAHERALKAEREAARKVENDKILAARAAEHKAFEAAQGLSGIKKI